MGYYGGFYGGGGYYGGGYEGGYSPGSGGGGGGYTPGGGGGSYSSGGYGSYAGYGTGDPGPYSSNINPANYGSGYYSNTGYDAPPGYAYQQGYASPSNPYGYTNTEDVGGPKGAGATTQPSNTPLDTTVTHADGSQTSVSFNGRTQDGLTGNQPVTERMSGAFSDILANDSNAQSVNVSATTNGQHVAGSDHYVGDAVDVNYINGVHVGTSGDGLQNAMDLEASAMNDPDVRYVEGPAGNFVRSSPGANWSTSGPIDGMNSHVHISVFPVK